MNVNGSGMVFVTSVVIAFLSSNVAAKDAKAASGSDFEAVCHERVVTVADEVCSVTKVGTVENTDTVYIEFVLTPDLESDIRCRMELTPPERWDGRLWGVGNGGFAGNIPNISFYRRMNTTAVTTDLGTSDAVKKVRNTRKWAKAVQHDYQWRATHLMTVYAKQLVQVCYGRPPKRTYFNGGSCGGRQGFSEAIRFPGDYDGIVAHVPSNNTIANHLNKYLVWLQTHDDNGKLLFTKDEMRVVADAAVEYFATKDPKPYAGHYLADGRVSAKELDEILGLAAKNKPSLLEGDKIKRLKGLYSPFYGDGECLALGFAASTYLGDRMYYVPPEKKWQEIRKMAFEEGPWYNANGVDLSAFFKRGGKLIMTTGWEDQTVSPLHIVEHYERICAHEGGLENAMKHCRLFCVPGGAHGGGIGRATQGELGPVSARRALIEWVENGKPPERILVRDRPQKKLFPVTTYPGLLISDDKGGWKRVERPRSKILLSDIMFKCDPAPKY